MRSRNGYIRIQFCSEPVLVNIFVLSHALCVETEYNCRIVLRKSPNAHPGSLKRLQRVNHVLLDGIFQRSYIGLHLQISWSVIKLCIVQAWSYRNWVLKEFLFLFCHVRIDLQLWSWHRIHGRTKEVEPDLSQDLCISKCLDTTFKDLCISKFPVRTSKDQSISKIWSKLRTEHPKSYQQPSWLPSLYSRLWGLRPRSNTIPWGWIEIWNG